MSKMRKSGAPYLPITGVNYDSESLAVGESDCLDISNLRIDSHELRTRQGLNQVGVSNTYVDANTYTEAQMSGTWTGVFRLSELLTHETPCVLRIIDSAGTVFTMTENTSTGKMVDEFGVDCFDVNDLATFTDLEKNGQPWPKLATGVQYSPVNPGGDTQIIANYIINANHGYPFLAGEFVVHMAIHRDPDEGEVLFAFTNKGIYKYEDAGGDATATFTSVLNSALVGTFTAISHWSTSEFTDSTIGATMVAAGGIPPSSADTDETDGDDRVLLYWDKANSEFNSLAPRYESSETVYTWLGTETPSGGSPLNFTAAVLPPIDESSVSIYWWDGDYKWILTADTAVAGVCDLLDPDSVARGTINLYTGAIQLTDLPEKDTGATEYAPTAGIVVTIDYTSEIYMRPRFVFNMNNRLIMVNSYHLEWDGVSAWDTTGTYRPWRVSWSDVTDITKIDITLSFADNVGVDTSAYVAGEYIGDMLILYRQNSAEQMFYVGGSAVFGFRTSVNHGLYAGNTVGIYKDLHFYMGKDNVYVYDGNTAKAIGDDRVREHILGVAKSDTLDKYSSFVDHATAEYWLLVSTTTDTYPSRAYVFSINQNAWSVYNFPKNITTIQFRSGHFEKPLVGTDDGYVLALSSANHDDSWDEFDVATSDWLNTSYGIDVMLETKDFVFGPLEDLDRIQRVVFEANSDGANTFAVIHSLDYGDTYSASTTVAMTDNPDDCFYWIDYTTRKMRFKITSSDYFVMRYMQISGLGKEEK